MFPLYSEYLKSKLNYHESQVRRHLRRSTDSNRYWWCSSTLSLPLVISVNIQASSEVLMIAQDLPNDQ